MSIVNKAFKGAIWLSFLRGSGQIVSWLTTIIVARILSPSDYGLMDMATILTGYVVLFSSLGLGLSIIYGIIKSVKGKIEVQSEINVGTTFSVYFPATGVKAEVDYDDYSIELQNGNKTILIIDDEPMIREMSSDMLSTLGYKVLVSNNGNDGIKLFQENPDNIDLVILDLLMPEMNGKACFTKLREIKNDVKVIISSGVADLSKRKELEKLGVTGYLEKPFSLKTIADSLNKIFN